MNIALWIVQALLAFAFVMAGGMKLATPHAELIDAGMGGWVADSPALLIKFIGLSEVAAGLGLILPGLTKIQTWLTPLAAAGLVTVMALAAGTHAMYGELASLPPNVMMGAMAAFVAWGRFKASPLATRTPATA